MKKKVDAAEQQLNGRRAHQAFALFFGAYAAFLIFSLPQYGPIWDVVFEFPRATAYVSHMLGEATPSGASPWHQLPYQKAQSDRISMNGCLPSLVAAATGKFFYEKLQVLGHIDAYHLGLVLIWLLFVIHFYFRLAELHGSRIALLATILLTLAPRIVAHVPNNMKDIPALAFGTAALLELAVALTRERPWRIYLTALFVGCAISSKFVAGIIAVPGAALVYLALRKGGPAAHLRRACILPLASIPIVATLVFIAHWPYLWVPPAELWMRIGHLAETIGERSGQGASFYPFIMAAITTPISLLGGLACAAGVAGWQRARSDRTWPPSQGRAERCLLAFYAVWMLAVLSIFSSGVVALFDGVRHFILFLPPTAVLAAWGIHHVSRAVLARFAPSVRNTRGPEAMIVVLILLASIVPIVRYHPYEITYFNGLVGGLPGATKIRLGGDVLNFEPRDYWGTSIRASIDWANEHLPKGAAVWISVPPDFSHLPVFRLRDDLAYLHPKLRSKRRPHYLIFINRQGWLGRRERHAIEHNLLVHQEEIQGIPLSFVSRLPEKRNAKQHLRQEKGRLRQEKQRLEATGQIRLRSATR